ncbi:MAG: 30S ribosome-binding factor RbfA [Clostridia bacterium]|nr:30S ribosome-binding factor RbfA [Clostridia bacterium]
MKISRTYRLDSEYQKEISNIINTTLKNRCPELKSLISVTSVSVAPDLKSARVLVSIYTADNAKKSADFKLLRENAGFIRHELSQRMRMRTVPSLQFLTDDSLEYGAHMDELFRKIHEQENSQGTAESKDEEEN